MALSSRQIESGYKSIVDEFSKPVALFEDSQGLIYANQQFNGQFSQPVSALDDLLPDLNFQNLDDKLEYQPELGGWVGELKSQHCNRPYLIKVVQMVNSVRPRYIVVLEPRSFKVVAGKSRAQLDGLTQLPNRYSFLEILEQRIAKAQGKPEFAVLYLDIDHFKDINELYGHDAGDHLLTFCAEKVRGLLRHYDVLGRLSGDEFAAIVDCRESHEMQYLCHRIMRYFERPFFMSGQRYQLTVSIGVVFYPEQGETAQQMIINAEKAMFTAKRRGRAQYQLFDRKQSLKIEKQQRIAESMRHVLTSEEEQFSAVYQPLYHLQSGEFIGVEVLARWHSPEFGAVSPGEFIPLAESRGLINQLSCRIFKVIKDDILSQQLSTEGRKPILAVNVSAQQISDEDFERKLIRFHEQVAESGWQLEVELTETQLMSMSDVIIDRLGTWQSYGMRIAIDDFGTGYSCLAYLHMLPVNKLKIDRQFLQAETKSRKEDEIMYAIMSMARALNIEVLAEGIETTEQFRRLQKLGCSTGQGFGLARPQAWRSELMGALPLK
ncbi:putative bifunctional diguanylate cyclase/phosphodiesterase [Reinekea marinisedimentorum]|uniref:Diguanylate cyclase (GGDEF)-like protein n=1 Tax=Reinekea marinisedimentorum TaxID=230495 RepID=A0A4R3I9P7_9GAMM|nr:EAL domain-containing protein [Reinekea marinisedimentorum]TCS43129.1 diguanylate cyclase (GGDEF)-like protein [Reinekea marinisedimentorum]